jgi:hypothetical protein
MHDVSYRLALYVALTGALLLCGLSICRQVNVRLPAPFDRWVQQGGIADRLVRKLSLVSLMILLLWLLRML